MRVLPSSWIVAADIRARWRAPAPSPPPRMAVTPHYTYACARTTGGAARRNRAGQRPALHVDVPGAVRRSQGRAWTTPRCRAARSAGCRRS
ncbi:hypothetical protein BIWAKO_02161 [Bosea sp. BIWAKO-01]|nr:hypothetical protein BIWAKO_02161 [Bosea sp. BIWAKO-01]